MAAIIPDSSPASCDRREVSLLASFDRLEAILNQVPECRIARDVADALLQELSQLHIQLRRHRAASRLCEPVSSEPIPPEYAHERKRLDLEHPQLLGKLDRLIRAVDMISDRTLEDQEVFMLRVRELIATLRRYEAEEDRLFYLAVWRDTGGES